MTIRVTLSTVLVSLVFAAAGAGVAVGVMVWEPWDGDGGDDRAGVEPSPIIDTPSLQPTDVLDLFTSACLGEIANELVLGALPSGANRRLNNQEWRDWLKSTFEYEADGWWRVRPSGGVFWRIHEFTAEVMPAC